jgi:hypothetical protein
VVAIVGSIAIETVLLSGWRVCSMRWLWLMFRIDPRGDAKAFLDPPSDGLTDNLSEILERLQDAERKHSSFAIGIGTSAK